VLAPGGQFIVSTPNQLYYTESRGAQGANPFHVHEFAFEEFRAELNAVFPHVSMFLENHMEGVTFQPQEAGTMVDIKIEAGQAVPDESHFFIAVCAHRPQLGNPTFVYVPRAANVLRERERHIGKLEGELAQKDEWLGKSQRELADVNAQHTQAIAELEQSNFWARRLNDNLAGARMRIVQLQKELEREQNAGAEMASQYAAKVAALEDDLQAKVQWATDLNAEVDKQTAALGKAVDQLHKTEKDLEERTAWALGLQKDLKLSEETTVALRGQLGLFQTSRWVRLGRKIGLGPAFPAE
jgi:DNA repair exonuclease SbcCD ATPase subunit